MRNDLPETRETYGIMDLVSILNNPQHETGIETFGPESALTKTDAENERPPVDLSDRYSF